MDFLDPKKQRAHKLRLMIGYVLVAIAIMLATVILLYEAYGYGVNGQGEIIQNGLVFVSSTPTGGQLYVDGALKDTTNSRMTLPAGTYTMQIRRSGYRTWQRAITIDGGSVVRYDYPFLFPTNLVTKPLKEYTANPSLATQSLDRRWLLVEQPGSLTTFDQYDFNNPSKASIQVTIPAGVLTTATGAQSISFVQWSNDNRHVLLKHSFSGTSEYIMLDQQDPTKSINLSKTLNFPASDEVTLQNDQYDHYFVYDPTTTVLGTVNLGNTAILPLVQYVTSYKTYGSNIVLYATTQNAPAGEMRIMLYQNGKTYLIRTVTKDSTYLLNLTQYSGSWYIVAGVPHENKVYVYQDPATILQQPSSAVLVPVDVLKVNDPTYVSFSANAQYIMAEGGTSFAVYDARYDKDYRYTIDTPLDAPQTHATWMDSAHIAYVSKGVLTVFDYDSTNLQALQQTSPSYLPFFDQNYKFVYGLAPQTGSAPVSLTSTALLTPADQ